MSSKDFRIRARFLYVWRLRRSRLRAEFHARIANHVAGSYAGGVLFDVGCGPGLLDGELKRRLTGLRVIGVDIDREMLTIAHREAGVEPVQASASYLPFREAVAQTLVSSASLKDWNDRAKGLRELARILASDGTAFVYDFVTVGPGSSPHGFAQRFGLLSDVVRRLAAVLIPFSIEDARRLTQALGRDVRTDVLLEPDLGALKIVLKKLSC